MTDWITEAEQKVSDGLVKMANQGSVPAANAVLKLLREKREASASEQHHERMEGMIDKPCELCRYLGEMGQPIAAATERIGRALSDEEIAAHKNGQSDRALEIRAIEISQVRNGNGKIETWMRRST